MRDPVRFVKPGQPVPGLPASMAELLAASETYDSPVPMENNIRRFGVPPTALETWVRDTVSIAPAPTPAGTPPEISRRVSASA